MVQVSFTSAALCRGKCAIRHDLLTTTGLVDLPWPALRVSWETMRLEGRWRDRDAWRGGAAREGGDVALTLPLFVALLALIHAGFSPRMSILVLLDRALPPLILCLGTDPATRRSA